MSFPLFIALRYIKAKKGIHAVNIIVFFSILAITISTAAMVIFLSVFSGLQKLNIELISNVNPEIKISSTKGKTLKNIAFVEKQLTNNKEIKDYSKVIEEKVYITFKERSDVAILKAIDKNFLQVIDTTNINGELPSFEYSNEMIMGNELSYRMSIPISTTEFAEFYMPKAGEGRITNIEDNFNVKPVYLKGVFFINEQYDNTVFTPLELGQDLLDLPKNSATEIYIKLQNPSNREHVKTILQKQLNKEYLVETREDQDAAFLKMMNIEKLIIYLILTLITIITTFNLAGAIIVIILDKKAQTKSLISIGLRRSQLKSIFFLTGFIMVIIGMTLGLVLGITTVFLQDQFHLIWANAYFPFPVAFEWSNFTIVITTILLFGSLVSFLSSRKITT